MLYFTRNLTKNFRQCPKGGQKKLASVIRCLENGGPNLGRPTVDILDVDADTGNLPEVKELRLKADGGDWRMIFVIDPAQQLVLLAVDDKSGVE